MKHRWISLSCYTSGRFRHGGKQRKELFFCKKCGIYKKEMHLHKFNWREFYYNDGSFWYNTTQLNRTKPCGESR